MKTKLLVTLSLLLLAGTVFITFIFDKNRSSGLVPIDTTYLVNYKSSTRGSNIDDTKLVGHLNYDGILDLKVKSISTNSYVINALLNLNSVKSHPILPNSVSLIEFEFTQSKQGIIKKIAISEDVSDQEYSIVLNLLSNLTHKLYDITNKPVRQELFAGESITRYSEISLPVVDRKVSFKYLNTKRKKVSGGGFVLLRNDFYVSLENKYSERRALYDRREQIRDVSFLMRKIDDQALQADRAQVLLNKRTDSLTGENLKKRFKLEEMKSLIWDKSKNEIRERFFQKESDGQPWYEYMAYYYVNIDKRTELNEDFKQYPEKRGDIALVMTAIGDDLAQKQFVDLVSSQSQEDQNNYFRYGVFVDNPNEDLIEAYKGFSSQSGKQAETAEKILASLYHKHLGSGEYDTDVENLISGLNSDSVKDQRHRYSVLGNLGYPQVPQNLGTDLSSSDEDIERLAIDSLRFNEDQESYEILKTKAESNNSAVRLSALESLRGDYIDDAYDFYEGRMQVEGNKDNRLQLLKNIFDLRNTDPRYVDLVSNEVKNCAYQEICTAAKKMLNEM